MNRTAVSIFIGLLTFLVVLQVASPDPKDDAFHRHNLVSDLRGQAEHRDPNLVNPWGIAFSPTGPFWIADNHSGVSTVYDAQGNSLPDGMPLIVQIPPPSGGMPPAAPTGIVFNGTGNFTVAPGMPAAFIFATEDGTISGWNHNVDATHAILKIDNSPSTTIYKGLAMDNAGTLLFATDFHNGKIDVFDINFAPTTVPGGFTDPNLPAGYAPFGIRNLGGNLYVTYALQDANKEDDTAGPGNGFVDIFNTSGILKKRLISRGALNSPWGLAIAPQGFGKFGGALLAGNFGDGTIHAFDAQNGGELGGLSEPSGRAITISGLWALTFGNGGQAGDPGVLYFTAGIAGGGEVEDHGLFGEIRPQHGEPGDKGKGKGKGKGN